MFARPRAVDAGQGPLAAWLVTVIAGVFLVIGLTVAVLLWPIRDGGRG